MNCAVEEGTPLNRQEATSEVPSPLRHRSPAREFNPTPLDNLLAVAELEFNQQQNSLELDSDTSSLHRQLTKFNFLSDCDRDIMSFDIHDPSKHGDVNMYFGHKSCSNDKIQENNPYHNNIVVSKDLFESITEGHYLPELVGSHDETINANELLDSLVEKGCEDNQILGHNFDKLAHLVTHDTTEYNGEHDMLLHHAPVTDIIDRLEQSMSPGQNSITAAQGLLHLQQMSEELVNRQLNGNTVNYAHEPYDETGADCDLNGHAIQQEHCIENAIQREVYMENEIQQDELEDNHIQQHVENEIQQDELEQHDIRQHELDDGIQEEELDPQIIQQEINEETVQHKEIKNSEIQQVQLNGNNIIQQDIFENRIIKQDRINDSFLQCELNENKGELPQNSNHGIENGIEDNITNVVENGDVVENTVTQEDNIDHITSNMSNITEESPVDNSANNQDALTESEFPTESLVDSTNDNASTQRNKLSMDIHVHGSDEDESVEPNNLCNENIDHINNPSNPLHDHNKKENGEISVNVETLAKTNNQNRDSSTEFLNEILPTDLSFKHIPETGDHFISRDPETTEVTIDSMSDKSDELPKDLTCHKRADSLCSSPKRIEIPRPPSRESDAMQSPQPSGIPAIPSSPEIFTAPNAKSNKSLFLETLLASPSPKMYFSSELTITKHQVEPLNLGKHRKSASPTVSSCSDDIKKIQKEYGEPEEKRIKKESVEGKANQNITKGIEDINMNDLKSKKGGKHMYKSNDDISPLKQLQLLKMSNDFAVPDPLLVPKDKLNDIITSPGREIPALLLHRPELRLPEAFAFPAILQDPDILVISLSQLENILDNKPKKNESDVATKHKNHSSVKNTSLSNESNKGAIPEGPPKQIPSMDALAGDIDAATSAALNQMLWLPYLSQIEAAVACSQNADFLKALNTSGYGSSHGSYHDISQMFQPLSRFMTPTGLPMMQQMDYNNQLEFAMWQEAMNQSNNAMAQRSKHNSTENQLKEMAKAVDAQNAFLQSTKNIQNRSAARTSPSSHSYNTNCHRATMGHNNQIFPAMYQNMNPNIRPHVPLPGLQIPHFNANMMAAQRSSRSQHQQKSPTSPYFHNNNYLNSIKQPPHRGVTQSPTQKRSSHQDSGKDRGNIGRPPAHNSPVHADDNQKPRISVRSLQNLLEPSQTMQQAKRNDYHPYHQSLTEMMVKPTLPHEQQSAKLRRQVLDASLQRRMLGHDEGEVGSTTAHEDAAAAQPAHPDPHTHLWHPLFGNQKGYNSPWNWTTVTVNGGD